MRQNPSAMPVRSVTFVRTGMRVERCAPRLAELYDLARSLRPEDFTAEETRTFDVLREHMSLAFVEALRAEVSVGLGIPEAWMPLEKFAIYGCGPISLHDDKFRYPGVYFVIVVAHSGRLGLVDRTSRAIPHAVGEILLLDPYRKHALVPTGRAAKEHTYERTHSPVHSSDDQFLFFDFDVKRPLLRDRFRVRAGTE
jgi:hypothetical protein